MSEESNDGAKKPKKKISFKRWVELLQEQHSLKTDVEFAGRTKVDRTLISRIKNDATPSHEVCLKIAEAFGINPLLPMWYAGYVTKPEHVDMGVIAQNDDERRWLSFYNRDPKMQTELLALVIAYMSARGVDGEGGE